MPALGVSVARVENAPVCESSAGGGVPLVPLRARRSTCPELESQKSTSPLRGSVPMLYIPVSFIRFWADHVGIGGRSAQMLPLVLSQQMYASNNSGSRLPREITPPMTALP